MKVERLDVNVDGPIDFLYQESGAADNPEWASALEAAGQRTLWRAKGRFTVVVPPCQLAFEQDLDFGPNTRPIPFRMEARLEEAPGGSRIFLAAESISTKHWALLAKPNLVGQLERLVERAEAVWRGIQYSASVER